MLDSTREKILRDPRERRKVQEEIEARQAEIGLRGMVALKGQDEFQILKDLENNSGKIEDQLAAGRAARERREKSKKEEARRRRMEMAPEIYARLKEKEEREAYERRKITIHR